MKTTIVFPIIILAVLTGSTCQLKAGVTEDLEAQITAGKIIFDTGSEAKLKEQLLRKNSGTKVTEDLQKLVLALSKKTKIRVSSLIRTEGHHGSGRAVDIGNEEIAKSILPDIATDAMVKTLKIDEIIFDAKVADAGFDRNKWNYNEGKKHDFDNATLNDHKNHIHFAVTAP